MEDKHYRIAALLTCHNRRSKTLRSLQSLFVSLDHYNSISTPHIDLNVFLTHAGCTDGTAETVSTTFADRHINIICTDGNSYWAGGMRQAWQAALSYNAPFDFFLLLNDDTFLLPECFDFLLQADAYVRNHYGQPGLYAGIVSSLDGTEITYGGGIYKSRILGRSRLLKPIGVPQPCQLTNGNILLVSRNVYNHIGIIDEHYCHRCADWAYGVETCRKEMPVVTTAEICGRCDNDHLTLDEERQRLLKMTIRQRYHYFFSPPHCTQDILYYMHCFFPIRYVLVFMARMLNILAPSLYYRII